MASDAIGDNKDTQCLIINIPGINEVYFGYRPGTYNPEDNILFPWVVAVLKIKYIKPY